MKIVDFFEQQVVPKLSVDDVYAQEIHNWINEGEQLKGACPFHKSKSGGSFSVEKSSLKWYCQGCKVGGGPVQYIHMLNGGVGTPHGSEYVETIRILAEKAGLEIPGGIKHSPKDSEAHHIIEVRRALMESASKFFQANLRAKENEYAMEYLAGRGLTADDIENLELGFFPHQENVRRYLISQGFSSKDIAATWVADPKMQGYIVFPWRDERGRMLTFYGRWPGKNTPPGMPKTIALSNPKMKDYDGDLVHTKCSPLYLDRALRDKHRDIVAVEGLLDAALLQVRGDTRVVAYVGAQFTHDQIDTMCRAGINSVIICPDPDSGGDKGAIVSVKSLIGTPITPYVTPRIPEGMDPDEVVLKCGMETWHKVVDAAQHGLSYLAEQHIAAHKPEAEWTDKGKVDLIRTAKQEFEKLSIHNAYEQEMFFWKPIADALGLTKEELAGIRGQQTAEPEPVNGTSTTGNPTEPSAFTTVSSISILIESGQGCLSRMVDQAENALIAGGYPLFQRVNEIVLITRNSPRITVKDVDKPDEDKAGIRWPEGQPQISQVSPHTLHEYLDQSACWQKISKKGDPYNTSVPKSVIDCVIARPEKKFRTIMALTETPTLRPDGSLISEPGFDTKTQILFEPIRGEDWSDLQAKCDAMTVEQARPLILEAFLDFHFQEEFHRSAAIAGTLTPMVRSIITGNVPLTAVTASTPAEGKSLLCDTMAMISSGRMFPRMSSGLNNEEDEKRITALCRSGTRMVLVDNVDGGFGNASWDALLTGLMWTGRVLGVSEMWSGPNLLVPYLTGNNVYYRGDMARRVVPINLHSDSEDPEKRTGFTHPNLLSWTQKNRVPLVCAYLSVLQKFIRAGNPLPTDFRRLGGFEGWSDLIRGVILWMGLPDPELGRDDVKKNQDPQTNNFRLLLKAWRTLFKDEPCTLASLVGRLFDTPISTTEEASVRELLLTLAPMKTGKSCDSVKLGYIFRRYKDRILDGHMLQQYGTRGGSAAWQVTKVVTPDAGKPKAKAQGHWTNPVLDPK
ncbi:MAG: hypothetical protein HQM09_21530 [Candidatus Riflebacteria bacterium]|nr:hypothetical protein [Candidatus Riflebacteria bacterium]